VDWALRWRYWLAGAAVLAGIWGVEVLRKGGLIWPWPLVPLVIWAVVLVAARLMRKPVA
jgi:hypothetical protein